MKKGLVIIMIIIFSMPVLIAQNNQSKIDPSGTWKFEAPYAPEGYSSGKIVVGLDKQIPTTTMSFTGSDSTLTGENVKTVNDSVLFNIYLEGQDIKVMLKIENDTIMTGKAIYSEGEVPLSLTKILASEAEVKK